MQSNPLLRRYIDIVNERVVMGPDGKPLPRFGADPQPIDPNSPQEIQRQARIKRRQDAEAAEQSWLGQAPKGYGMGGRLPANLKPADVQRVLAGENPDQIFMGRSQRGMFGPDAAQHKAMAQQWLDWQKTAPPKYDPLADIDEPQDIAPVKEASNELLRRLSDIVQEAEQFKGITNQGQKSQDMMKKYKPKD